jgi:hypothetical protein
MNLDAFWSRATDTVDGQRGKLEHSLKLSKLVGLMGPYKHDGPMPSYDHCGYEVAIQMLLNSRNPGKYSKDYCQWDTIRKIRTAYANQVRASSQANQQAISMGDQDGKYQRLSTDPCASFWFYRFLEGCKRRMGQDWRPNQALSMKLMLAVLDMAESRINDAVSEEDAHRWIVFHAYAVISYVVSLRGSEGLLLDLETLHRFWGTGKEKTTPYLIIPLKGKLKGESNHFCHLIPCVLSTSSGIDVEGSLHRLRMKKQALGFVDGPAISNLRGQVLTTRSLDDTFCEILEELFETARELFPINIKTIEDLRLKYQGFRSFRRTSATRATEEKIHPSDIDVVNRWKTVEKANGKRPSRPMRQHYAQLSLLLKPFLRYTLAM